MPHPIVAIADLQHRLPEHGRLRMGVKTVGRNGKPGMKSIDTWRLTSPDQFAIEQLAEQFGGECKPWHDDKANPKDQFEVITRVNEIGVFLPPSSLSLFYELWGGGGVERRCDGVTVEVPGVDDMIEKPCLCVAANAMKCKPYLRLSVIIPTIRFGGAWRLETKGWEAVHEMPGMEQMIEALQSQGIVSAKLRLEQRSKMTRGQRRIYVVPRLLIPETPLAMLEGAGRVQALASGEQARPALPAASEPVLPMQAEAEPDESMRDAAVDWFDDDDDVVDAELVDHGQITGIGERGFTADPPAPEEENRPGPHRAANPRQAKLAILAAEVAGVSQVSHEDTIRHALAWKLSGGRTEASSELTDDEKGKVIDALQGVLDGKVKDTWLPKLIESYMGRPM